MDINIINDTFIIKDDPDIIDQLVSSDRFEDSLQGGVSERYLEFNNEDIKENFPDLFPFLLPKDQDPFLPSAGSHQTGCPLPIVRTDSKLVAPIPSQSDNSFSEIWSDVLKVEPEATEEPTQWICHICSKSFRHHYTLTRHLPTHTDVRNFKCETCGKAFRQMSTLSQHRAIHSNARPHVCCFCGKTFNRVSTLISHRKTHTEKKSHVCEICGKAFHQKGNLRNHIFTHTNARPYKCDICGNGFNQKSNLMCHRQQSHAERSRHNCGRCDLAFPRRVDLRHHEKWQHGIEYPARACEKISRPVTKTEVPDGHDKGILIDYFVTPQLLEAWEQGRTPYAWLKHLNGSSIGVVVKVLPAINGKHRLVPVLPHEMVTPNFVTVQNDKVFVKVPLVAVIHETRDHGYVVERIPQ